jgi:hypothetical protein
MTLKVYVSKKIEGKNIVDVSLETGLDIFRPYSDYEKMVLAVLNTEMSQEELKESYLSKMRLSYKKNKKLWNWFLKQDTIIFGCDCSLGSFCHAYYLAEDIFPKLGAEYCGERN